MKIKVLDDILGANDHIALQNRKLFDKFNVLVINLMSAPGAGKTSLLETTIKNLGKDCRIGVIEGDIETTRDAEKMEKFDIPVVQINTQSVCHLDAGMIRGVVEDLPLEELDLLFIENVGNLVCPAEFKVGEHHKVMLLSVTEGDDKPLKYPLMFRESSVMLINKIDLLPYTDFSVESARDNAQQINPQLHIIELSCKTGAGLSSWLDWLRAGLISQKEKGHA
jgi:hydrogenase nickel incorporation protein HypB